MTTLSQEARYALAEKLVETKTFTIDPAAPFDAMRNSLSFHGELAYHEDNPYQNPRITVEDNGDGHLLISVNHAAEPPEAEDAGSYWDKHAALQAVVSRDAFIEEVQYASEEDDEGEEVEWMLDVFSLRDTIVTVDVLRDGADFFGGESEPQYADVFVKRSVLFQGEELTVGIMSQSD